MTCIVTALHTAKPRRLRLMQPDTKSTAPMRPESGGTLLNFGHFSLRGAQNLGQRYILRVIIGAGLLASHSPGLILGWNFSWWPTSSLGLKTKQRVRSVRDNECLLRMQSRHAQSIQRLHPEETSIVFPTLNSIPSPFSLFLDGKVP